VTVTDCLPHGVGTGAPWPPHGEERPRAAGGEGEPGAVGPGWAAATEPTAASQATVDELVVPGDLDELLNAVFDRAEPERLGLAVLVGVVDDLTVEHGEEGTRVRMSWPARC
jgi:hypothetical protein